MDEYLESLSSAIRQLDRAVEAYAADRNGEFIRDALITRFTFTFSQVVTTLGRYLETVYFVSDARVLSPRQMVRHAARLGFLTDCESWLQHVENRNRVSHAYLESMAIMVAEGTAGFAADARALLVAMERGIADGG